MKDILRVEDAAKELGVSTKTVRNWYSRSSGALRVSRPTKGTVLITRVELTKFIERFIR